jgi:hypothetical protein
MEIDSCLGATARQSDTLEAAKEEKGRIWLYEAPFFTYGAIAQLAERLDRTQEVGGSNPPSSIDFSLQGTSFD